MNDTRSMTTYGNGTMIQMSACDAKNFLLNLAITTISQCKNVVFNKDKFEMLETTIDLPEYDRLIDEYCDGVHGAVLWCMITQNVKILYAFVQDCVLNESVAGLFLLRERNDWGGEPWNLITGALDEYVELVNRQYEFLGEKRPTDMKKYNEYNNRFRELMNQ